AQQGTMNQCILWHGTAASATPLLPSGYNQSYCFGVAGGQQIGYVEKVVYFTTTQHAVLWSGSSDALVDLHPAAFLYSKGLALAGGQQVGYGSSFAYGPVETPGGYQSTDHALLWAGSAASVVDLHPYGFDASSATSTNGVQQAGWAYSSTAVAGSYLHAMMWLGAAASAVDLHPAGYTDSRVNGMNSRTQVGDAWMGLPNDNSSEHHALAWTGSALSVVDLNQFMPPGYKHAVATGIDNDGNISGYVYNAAPIGTQLPADAAAVMWIPGDPSPYAISSFTVTPANVAPGGKTKGTVTLAGAAPVGGVAISFFSGNTAVVPTPANVTIPAGATTVSFAIATNAAAPLTVPTDIGLYASDGSVTRVAVLTVTPVVKLLSLSAIPVQGGQNTTGIVTLTIPAQAGGAVVALTSGKPAVAILPASVTVPQGSTSATFTIGTVVVKTAVNIPIAATYRGVTVQGSVGLNPAPVVALAAVSVSTPVVGGQPFTGTVVLTNPANAPGATIYLKSANPAVATVPVSVVVPAGMTSVTFTGTTTVVAASTVVNISARYAGVTMTAALTVDPIPPVTITQAQYWSISKLFKVEATTPYPNSVLTYGINVNGPALGTMQFEKGMWKGSMVMDTAPALAVVWNSVGGMATLPVEVKAK
ncbi:MAG: hypothetical protein ABI693_14555, partial [Bryobacteraceae bacterium]